MNDMVWNKLDERVFVYGGSWSDISSSVKAKTFEVLVELASERIKEYKSDLFHDALWINESIAGPLEFDWIVRDSGTFIGDVVKHVKLGDWPGSMKYRFVLEQVESKWVLGIWEAGPMPNVPDTVASIDNDHCHAEERGEICQGAGENCIPEDDSDGTYTEDDQGNWHRVEDEQFAKLILETVFPTHENDNQIPKGKGVANMDEIISDLREKLDEAESVKDTLEEHQNEIERAVDELKQYVSDVEDLIDSLESLPSVSIDLDLDSVSFDS